MRRVGLAYSETNHLTLRRGPYVVAAGIDESTGGADAVLKGHFLNLFDPNLPTLESVAVSPGTRYFLLDLDKVKGSDPAVLAGASKILGAKSENGFFTFHAEGPDGIETNLCLHLPGAPGAVKVDGEALPDDAKNWDASAGLFRIKFPNKSEGRRVEVSLGTVEAKK